MSRHIESERKVILWGLSLIWEPQLNAAGPMIAFGDTLVTIRSIARPASEQGVDDEEEAEYLYWLFPPAQTNNFRRLLLLSS